MALSLISCDKDFEEPLPSTIPNTVIEFAADQMDLPENGSLIGINLKFSKAAHQDGTLTIELDTLSSRFKVDKSLRERKLELSIEQGQQAVSFNVLPTDNQLVDGNLSIHFTILSASAGFSIGAQKSFMISLRDNEQPQEVKTVISFASGSSEIREDEGNGTEILVNFSNSVLEAGTFEIELSSPTAQDGIHYRTEPQAIDGKITISPPIGTTQTSIWVFPINNQKIGAGLTLNASIGATSDSFLKGQQTTHQLSIADDDLSGLPKGYAISGPLGQRKTYHYDEIGRIASVLIESSGTSYTQTYHYDENDRLTKISRNADMNTIYTWTDNRITKSERIEFGILKEYVDYDYDAQGNVSGSAIYFRQPNGQYLLSFFIVYLYYTDNNLYKTMYYIPGEGDEEYTLLSTRTYEHYLDAASPFPMVEILPTVKAQTQLAGTFRLEEHGMNLVYNLEYEFLPDGRVSRRYARNGNQVETTEYFYY